MEAPAPKPDIRASRFPLALEAVKTAAIATLVTFLLIFLVVGLGTISRGGRYEFTERWPLVGWICAAVFLGYLLFRLIAFALSGLKQRFTTLLHGRHEAVSQSPGLQRVENAVKAALSVLRPVLISLFVLLALAYPFLSIWLSGGLNTGRYWIDLGVLVMTYILLGWGLNIVVGLAGLLDLGYVAFYAVGAYTFALLAINFEFSFWICLPLAGVLAALWGVMLGFPVLRLRGDYLAIVTLAFGEIIRLVLINWREFSGGASGINRIPRPSFLGFEFVPDGPNSFSQYFGLEFSTVHRLIFFYFVILALALAVLLITIRLRRLPIGRAWEALREDEIACRSLGISVVNTKLTAFALGAMFGGFAGVVFASRQGFISPADFSFLQSALVLAIVVLGGLGSNLGVVFSAIALIGGVEMLRNLDAFTSVFGPGFEPAQYRMLIFGLLMVVIMVWRPRGLISSRTPTVFLKVRKAIGAAMVNQGRG